jgi:hypothetical protein
MPCHFRKWTILFNSITQFINMVTKFVFNSIGKAAVIAQLVEYFTHGHKTEGSNPAETWHWHFGILVFWHFGILAFWHFGIRHFGILEFWNFGIWHFDILTLWHFGILAFFIPNLLHLKQKSFCCLIRFCAIRSMFGLTHRYLKNIDCLSFVMCPQQAPHLPRAFLAFLLQPLTVLIRQTRQVVCASNQSIFLRCLWSNPHLMFFEC